MGTPQTALHSVCKGNYKYLFKQTISGLVTTCDLGMLVLHIAR